MAGWGTLPIPAAGVVWQADVSVPEHPAGLVLFAHESAGARRNPCAVAAVERLGRDGVATVRADLLTAREQVLDQRAGRLRDDVGLLAGRLVAALDWLAARDETAGLPIGLFGDGTGAAAALYASVRRPGAVRAVVTRNGRPDRAGRALAEVRTPTLLITRDDDTTLLRLNRQAAETMPGGQLLVTPGGSATAAPDRSATERVAAWTSGWFTAHLHAGPDAA